jgi:hypothetical protein
MALEKGMSSSINDHRQPTAASGRTRPVWDAVGGRTPLPPSAAILELELIGADPDNGTIEIAFAATEGATIPLENVVDGFLAAMLHDTDVSVPQA